MADRLVAMGLIIVAALGAIMLTGVLVAPLPGSTFPTEDIRILDVQFDEGCLNITVKNLCTQAKIVSGVTVRDLVAAGYGFTVNSTSTPYTVAVHEPVSVGEENSFSVSFNWSSGCAYQIELKSVDRDWETAYNVVAP
jgi:hypothetical protein